MRHQVPTTTNSPKILFSDHSTAQELLCHGTSDNIIRVKNLTQFLSVSLDFLNKIILPRNLNSVTDSQERLVDGFDSYTYTLDREDDVSNASEFKESKLELSPCFYEDVSIESIISLYIDELPQNVKCVVHYNTASITDDYCKKAILLFYRQLIKLHNYLPVYLAFENKSILNKLVTDIFGEDLSCIPYVTNTVALSVREIYQINQTLTSILGVAQLLQQYMVSLPPDTQEIITHNIASVPMADKVKSLSQMLKNEHSKLEEHSSLLHNGNGKSPKEVLSKPNQDNIPIADSTSYSNSKRKADVLNDVQDVSNKKLKISSAVYYVSGDRYAQGVNQCVFDQQQGIVDDSGGEVATTIGAIGRSDGDTDYIK